MQWGMDLSSAACENLGLVINTEKTVAMHQPPPNTAHNAPQLSVNGTHLQVGDNFTYLGSTLSRSTKIDDEVAHRIFKPSAPTTTTTSSTTNITKSDNDTAEFSCPHCLPTFTSRIGLVGHLRIHHTETGEPMPGTPTYTRHIRLHCPHCTRTFIHRMGLLWYMQVHENLR
nr:unnamed protein product [Spirometra erinaceieuropaei]